VRRAMGLSLIALVLALGASPAAAGPKIDLPTIVLASVDGYGPAPAGIGMNGPISKEQYIQLSGNTKRVRDALKNRNLRIYARTFARLDGSLAMFMGFQLDRPKASKGFLDGVKDGLKAEGIATTPVPGLPGAVQATQPPSAEVPAPQEQVFFRSGRLGFSVSVIATGSGVDPKAEVVRLAKAQADNVPADVAAEKDIADSAAYKLAPWLLLALVVVVVLLLIARRRRRRGRAAAEPVAAGDPPAPAPGPAPAAADDSPPPETPLTEP
jgi:hypothetical protein